MPLPAGVVPPPAVHPGPPSVQPRATPRRAPRRFASAAGLVPLESHADGSDVDLDGFLDDVDVDMYDSDS